MITTQRSEFYSAFSSIKKCVRKADVEDQFEKEYGYDFWNFISWLVAEGSD